MNKSLSEVLKDIKQKKLAPIYLIHGDEPFFIDQLTESFENNVLTIDEQSFNQFILFGKDHTMASVVSYARRYPMMAERQVIVVKEALFLENLGKGKSSAKDKGDEEWKAFEDYCLNPTPSTVLVFTIKNLLTDKSKLFPPLVKQGVIVACKKIGDDKVAQWLKEYLNAAQLTIKTDTIEMMVSYVGSDLKRMASEADKLIINLPAGAEVGSDEVEKYIGISREYNYFEFQKAIVQKNVEKAQKIAIYFSENFKQNPLPLLIIMLYGFFSKVLQVHDLANLSDAEIAKEIGINPYFVRDYTTAKKNYSLAKVVRILEEINQADLKSKGIIGQNVSDRDIILDLSFMILH
jgi:DNA polymerase-3 subunit delta